MPPRLISPFGESPNLALIDIEVERNGFGSQLESFTCEAMISAVASQPLPLSFIRAPEITKAGQGFYPHMFNNHVHLCKDAGSLF